METIYHFVETFFDNFSLAGSFAFDAEIVLEVYPISPMRGRSVIHLLLNIESAGSLPIRKG
jgi:hypothetical protein